LLKQQNIICLLKEYVTKISLKGILYVGKEISVTQTDIAINKTNIDLTRDALMVTVILHFTTTGVKVVFLPKRHFSFGKLDLNRLLSHTKI